MITGKVNICWKITWGHAESRAVPHLPDSLSVLLVQNVKIRGKFDKHYKLLHPELIHVSPVSTWLTCSTDWTCSFLACLYPTLLPAERKSIYFQIYVSLSHTHIYIYAYAQRDIHIHVYDFIWAYHLLFKEISNSTCHV